MTQHFSHDVTPEVQEFLMKIRDLASSHRTYAKYLGDVDELIQEEDLFKAIYSGHNNLYAAVSVLREKRPDMTGMQVFSELMKLRNSDKLPKYSDAFSQKLELELKSQMPAFALIAGAALSEIASMRADQKGEEVAAYVQKKGDAVTSSYNVLEKILGKEDMPSGSRWKYTENELRSKVEKEALQTRQEDAKKNKKKPVSAYVGVIAMFDDVKNLPVYLIRETVAEIYDSKYKVKGKETIREKLETLNTMAPDIIVEIVGEALEKHIELLMPEVQTHEEIVAQRPVAQPPQIVVPVSVTPAQAVPAAKEPEVPLADLIAVATAAQEAVMPDAVRPEDPMAAQAVETMPEPVVPTLEKRLKFVNTLGFPGLKKAVEAGLEQYGDRLLSYVEF